MFNKNFQSKTLQMLAVLVVPILLLAACSSAVAAQPIAEISWNWVGMTATEPATGSLVPNPESYTLFLNADGSLSLQVDCNAAGGSYALDGNSISIEVGPSTLAYCGEDSLDQGFLNMLSSVETYSLADGQLLLELPDGAGQMVFE